MSRPDPEQLQGTLVDFALLELIRHHRESFQPLWTVDSWAKLMIWLALNCGLSGERDSLEHFAAALGDRITSRLRRTFFERELADLELQVLADPAEQQVLMLSQAPQDLSTLNPDRLATALERVGLTRLVVVDRSRWQQLEAVVAIPWKN
ncbi:protein phosphatase [Synechococcus sp. MIT S9503]|uniref:protein phosphatase n=1 Tax=Synechococcus sp. MIT S9503 TaxID=3082547 RepID=UPI0039A5E471